MIDKKLLEQIIWDYHITPEEFLDILHGRTSRGWLNREWALVRAVERLQYYDLLELIPWEVLTVVWPGIRGRVWITHIREGLEYAIRRYTLSAAK